MISALVWLVGGVLRIVGAVFLLWWTWKATGWLVDKAFTRDPKGRDHD